jgi:hypothetical protein
MVKRTVAASVSLISLVVAPLMLTAGPAGAHAAGACTITGTITFAPTAPAAADGRWAVSPGVISCRGVYNGSERIINPGPFTASGTYTSVPAAGGCAVQLGSGTVDYWVLTSEQDIHFREPHAAFSPGSAGAFTTPTLRGAFQIPPDAGCLGDLAGQKAAFLAEVALVRHQGTGAPLPGEDGSSR